MPKDVTRKFYFIPNEPPPLSESLGSSKPLTLYETLAYSMPVARSIFVPTTPCHPAPWGPLPVETRVTCPQIFGGGGATMHLAPPPNFKI